MTTRPLTSAAREAAADTDREALRAALVAAGGSVAGARAALGWSHATIYRRLAAYGLAAWLRERFPVSDVQRARRAREREGR